MRHIFIKFTRYCVRKLSLLLFNKENQLQNGIKLILPNSEKEEIENKLNLVIQRLNYFNSDLKISIHKSLKLTDYVNYKLIGFIDGESFNKHKFYFKEDLVFNLDNQSNYIDGWAYHFILSKSNPAEIEARNKQGYDNLLKLKNKLKKNYNKAYIFGTGPSLDNIESHNWSDGIRIVSNTIVKCQESWEYINPHVIVAGDAIYHFGISNFAKNFRNDLRKRLKETETYFAFPDFFSKYCFKEFSEFKHRLIPIPQGKLNLVCKDLTTDYSLPKLGNVLPLLLLPIASTFSKDIYLWGFDGRSPDDKLFWKNSDKHFYTDDVNELMELHPAFFKKLVPKESPESYVKEVHGDILEEALLEGEKKGYRINMMHFSHTKNLNKRYVLRKNLL